MSSLTSTMHRLAAPAGPMRQVASRRPMTQVYARSTTSSSGMDTID